MKHDANFQGKGKNVSSGGASGGSGKTGAKSSSKFPCREWKRDGKCKFGKDCKFSHARSTSTPPANRASREGDDEGGDAPVAAGKDDELVEITPESIRLRKSMLKEHERKRAK